MPKDNKLTLEKIFISVQNTFKMVFDSLFYNFQSLKNRF